MVESITTRPWASLTFTGERHHLVVRLPGETLPAAAIAADELSVPGVIVAIERAEWATAGDGAILTLDLLAIATTALDELPTR